MENSFEKVTLKYNFSGKNTCHTKLHFIWEFGFQFLSLAAFKIDIFLFS